MISNLDNINVSVNTIGTTSSVGFKSNARSSLLDAISAKDGYSFSSESRQLSSKLGMQPALTKSNYSSDYNSSSILSKTSRSTVPDQKSSVTAIKKYVSPKQKDFEAFLAGQSFQEEFNESLVEQLQEEFLDININKASTSKRY